MVEVEDKLMLHWERAAVVIRKSAKNVLSVEKVKEMAVDFLTVLFNIILEEIPEEWRSRSLPKNKAGRLR